MMATRRPTNPVLFVNIGWADRYDGTNEDGTSRCGIGHGVVSAERIDVVFAARRPPAKATRSGRCERTRPVEQYAILRNCTQWHAIGMRSRHTRFRGLSGGCRDRHCDRHCVARVRDASSTRGADR
jgi:hypothetical protein